jgi:RNA polymerase sigma-70 factor (ECF subfamily)
VQPAARPVEQHAEDDTLTDEALMASVAAGDMDCLGRLVERHQGRTLRLARRITGDPEMAEDVAQEAFLRVYRSAKRYRPTARFTTWLHRIVVNLCWDHRRKWRGGLEQPPDRPDAGSLEPGDRISRAESRAAVRRAVLALPPRQRLAVVLHRFEGHTVREVAGITGWSESAVESCLVRAYRQLRRDLAEQGGRNRAD